MEARGSRARGRARGGGVGGGDGSFTDGGGVGCFTEGGGVASFTDGGGVGCFTDGGGVGSYLVSFWPPSARTMATPFFALAHLLAAADGAAGLGLSEKSSGTGSAVSGLEPNTVAVLTYLRDFFHRPAVFFSPSPSAGAAPSPPSAPPKARPPGTALAPVARIALT